MPKQAFSRSPCVYIYLFDCHLLGISLTFDSNRIIIVYFRDPRLPEQHVVGRKKTILLGILKTLRHIEKLTVIVSCTCLSTGRIYIYNIVYSNL